MHTLRGCQPRSSPLENLGKLHAHPSVCRRVLVYLRNSLRLIAMPQIKAMRALLQSDGLVSNFSDRTRRVLRVRHPVTWELDNAPPSFRSDPGGLSVNLRRTCIYIYMGDCGSISHAPLSASSEIGWRASALAADGFSLPVRWKTALVFPNSQLETKCRASGRRGRERAIS